MGYQIIQTSVITTPLISVIVPMYNVEKYISETILSLFSQTLANIELILIDDGSDDETFDIVKGMISNQNNVTLISQENRGPGAARNLGLTFSQGEYISFVDSDDLIPINALQDMYNAAVSNKVDLVTGMSLNFNSMHEWFINSHINEGVYKKGFKSLHQNPGMLYSVGPCNKLFKSTLIKDMTFPTNINITEDHPFIIEAYLRSGTFYTVDKIIYYYRQREDESNESLSQAISSKSITVIRDIMKSLEVSDQLWRKYEPDKKRRIYMQNQYYTRIIRADLWPTIRKIIWSRDKSDLLYTFNMIELWLKDMNILSLKGSPSIARLLTFQIRNNYRYLPPPIKKRYRSILKEFIKRTKPESSVFLTEIIFYSHFFLKTIFAKIKFKIKTIKHRNKGV